LTTYGNKKLIIK